MIGLAAATARQKRGAQAARLLGAVEALCDLTAIRPVDPVIHSIHEEGMASALATLGDERFAAERAAGRTLSLDQTFKQLLQGGQQAHP
jgi:hypothetical protein